MVVLPVEGLPDDTASRVPRHVPPRNVNGSPQAPVSTVSTQVFSRRQRSWGTVARLRHSISPSSARIVVIPWTSNPQVFTLEDQRRPDLVGATGLGVRLDPDVIGDGLPEVW